MFNALLVKMNKQLLTRQNANWGNFISGVNTAKSVQLMTDTTGEPRSIAMAKMIKEYQDALAVGNPFVFGSGNLDLFMKQKGIACCNANNGTDISGYDDFDYYKDQFAESIFGAKEFGLIMPGAVQLLTRNENIGAYVMENDLFVNDTITDPISGFTFDMDVNYIPCDKVYNVFLRLYYQSVFVNESGYEATDPLFGVNNTFNFVDTSVV